MRVNLLARLSVLLWLCLVIMAPLTSQVNTYVNGNVLTANQLNSEFGNLYSTINGLDEANLLSTTSIPPSKIASTIASNGIERAVDGSLSVTVDSSTIEINADTLRVKDGAITNAKLSSTITPTIGDGSAATPAIRFNSDPDTGIYRTSANAINFSTGATSRVSVDTQGLRVHMDGSNSQPSITWELDGDTGFYRPNNGEVSFTSNGVESFRFSNITTLFPSGNIGNPAVSFLADQDTGFYRTASGEVRYASDGAELMKFNSSGLEIANGGSFKVKIFTIGTSSSGNSSVSTAHGLTLANIISISGTMYDATNSQARGASTFGTTASSSCTIDYTATATNLVAAWSACPAVSKVFKATVFYQ